MGDTEQSSGTSGRSDRVQELVPFAGGIAIGMVLVAITWGIVAVMSSGSGDSNSTGQPAVSESSIAPPGGVSAVQPTEPTAMQRCSAAADLLGGPLDDARPAMDQWAVHVGAMNKLVVGQITLAQATAFWNQTRAGAHRWIRLFDHAEHALEQGGLDCPTPDLLGSQAPADLRACSQRVAAVRHTLELARTAVTTWRHHVHAMDQLRSGKLSPQAATQMWLTMWQRGVDEIDAYNAAARAEKHTGGCAGGAGAPAPAPETPSATPTDPMEGMN